MNRTKNLGLEISLPLASALKNLGIDVAKYEYMNITVKENVITVELL